MVSILRTLTLALLLTAGSSPSAAEPPPNIVMIISDDQAAGDFGFMKHPYIRTPHIDRLAGQSARYVNGYVPSSVCRPSLATLLTGLYPHQHGVHFNHPPPGFARMKQLTEEEYYAARGTADPLMTAVPTIPRTLAHRGYRSLQTGKHWEKDYHLAGFTAGMTQLRPSAGLAYGNLALVDGSVVAHGNGDAGLNIGRTTMKPIESFLDDQLAKHSAQPFLIWYAPFLPHLPHDAPERLRRPYLDNALVPRHMVDYSAACTWFDETVGQLVDMIERRGLVGTTMFVFVIDNGFEPGVDTTPGSAGTVSRRSKRSPFEAGLRTPILIRWDGRAIPATHEQLVSSVDIVPTLLEASGEPRGMGDLPGLSLMPSALGKKRLPDRPVFGEIYPGDAASIGNPARDVAYRWVREGEWKLIVPHPQQEKIWGDYVARPALFNVVNDPLERSDHSGDSQQTGRMEALRKLLDAWWNPDEST